MHSSYSHPCRGIRMISQFYVLSLRGDTIIFRDYLGNVQKVVAVLAASPQYHNMSSTPHLLC